jgi:hypothetical protein
MVMVQPLSTLPGYTRRDELGRVADALNLAAELTARHLGFSQIFTVVAIPGLIATAALVIKQATSPKDGH